MKTGIPDNQLPPLQLDLAGPANNKKGFYDWDKNNFGPRLAVAWSPTAKSGFLRTLTGEDQLVIRGGYSMLYDRVGFALATIFDQSSSFGMSSRIPAVFGSSDETVPGARFVNLSTRCRRRCRRRRRRDSRRHRSSGAWRSTRSLDDTITTPYHHVFNAVVGRELRRNFADRGGLRRASGPQPPDPPGPGDAVESDGHRSPAWTTSPPQGRDRRLHQGAASRRSARRDSPAFRRSPYWENLFPGAAGAVSGVALTATQRIARLFFQNDPDFSSAIFSAESAARRRAASSGPTRSSTASTRTWRRRARSRGPTTTRCS